MRQVATRLLTSLVADVTEEQRDRRHSDCMLRVASNRRLKDAPSLFQVICWTSMAPGEV